MTREPNRSTSSIAAIAVQPELVLFVMAYAYLVSGPIGMLMGPGKPSDHQDDRGDGDAAELPGTQTG